jgi:hypothetical protein
MTRVIFKGAEKTKKPSMQQRSNLLATFAKQISAKTHAS